jgi:hypothetical protein
MRRPLSFAGLLIYAGTAVYPYLTQQYVMD